MTICGRAISQAAMSTVTCCRPHTKLGVANNSQQVFNALLHRVRHLSGVSSRVVRAVFKPSENGASAHNQLRTARPLRAIQRRSEGWHTATSQREEHSGATLRRNAALGEWALEDFPGVHDVVEYESRINYMLPKCDMATVCT